MISADDTRFSSPLQALIMSDSVKIPQRLVQIRMDRLGHAQLAELLFDLLASRLARRLAIRFVVRVDLPELALRLFLGHHVLGGGQLTQVVDPLPAVNPAQPTCEGRLHTNWSH